MKVKAKRAMAYGRKHYAAGDMLEMSERDAKALQAVGRVVRVDESQVLAHAVRAQAEREQAAADEPHAKKGKYKRRDMRAENEPGIEGA